MRFRESGLRESSSSETSQRRDPSARETTSARRLPVLRAGRGERRARDLSADRVRRESSSCSRRRLAASGTRIVRHRGRPPARRLVVGQRAARRSRPQCSASSGGKRRTDDRCGHGTGAAIALRPASAGSGSSFPRRRRPGARASPASSRPLATAGSTSRPHRRDPRSAWGRGRLRRAHLAAPPRRARRRRGRSLARRRPPRRDRRIRRSAAGQARALDGARCSRRAPCSDRRASSSARTRACRRSCAPGFARRASTTCWPCRARTSSSSPAARSPSRGSSACPRLVGEIAALAAIGGYVLAVGWQPSVVRAGVAGVARVAGLARGEAERPLVLPPRRSGDPARLEPVLPVRRRVPALVRRGRCDLRRRPPSRAPPRRIPGPALAGGGGCRLRSMRGCDRSHPPHAVRGRSALFDPCERARRAGGRTPPRVLPS